MEDFDKQVSVGVVFDLSTVWVSGQRLLDSLKYILVSYVGSLGMSGRVYVSHPDWQKMPVGGESTYFVASYEEPEKFSIEKAFKDAVLHVGSQLEDEKKYIFVFTNRFSAPNNYKYRKGFLMNQIRDYGCKIVFFGIGDDYDKMTLSSVVGEYGGEYIHLPLDLKELENKLLEYDGK